jgi:DNA-directed RNA polymerase specialized sigma24 family protein
MSYTPVRARAAPHGEEAPEELGNPLDEAARLQEQELAHRLLATLDPDDQEMLRAVYGIECAPEKQPVYAARKGLAYRTIKRRLAKIREKLARRV